MLLYDAFYRWCRDATDETHNWPGARSRQGAAKWPACDVPAADDARCAAGVRRILREAVRVWARIAALSFGGPAGQIAVMHRILVEEKRWIGENRFLHALNYCMLLPGPEAQQLAVYIGWLLHGVRAGSSPALLFVLPGLRRDHGAEPRSTPLFGNVGVVAALFFGLKAAVLAIVLEAVVRVGKRALKNDVHDRRSRRAAFVAIFFFDVAVSADHPRRRPDRLLGGRAGPVPVGGGHGDGKALSPTPSRARRALPRHARPRTPRSLRRRGRVPAFCGSAPVALLCAALGPGNVFADIAIFFSKMAVVTFGGAYAVLAYVAQQAVETYRLAAARARCSTGSAWPRRRPAR